MARRRFTPCSGEGLKWIVLRLRYVMMYVLQNLLALCGGDFSTFGCTSLVDAFAPGQPVTVRTVRSARFANGFQRLLYRAVNKATGINDNHIRIVMAWHNVAFGAQLSRDAFRINRFSGREGSKPSLAGGLHYRQLKSVHLLEWSGRGF